MMNKNTLLIYLSFKIGCPSAEDRKKAVSLSLSKAGFF